MEWPQFPERYAIGKHVPPTQNEQRPISIINNDLKLFGHLLADRLAKVITSLISPDQMGLIPTRQITDIVLPVTLYKKLIFIFNWL